LSRSTAIFGTVSLDLFRVGTYLLVLLFSHAGGEPSLATADGRDALPDRVL